MRLESNRSSILLAYGFQESEARVYLALLDQPSLTASTLAKAARVPRSYLYNVIQDLHARGLVDILLAGGKRTYRARPFGDFLSKEAEQLRARLAEIERDALTVGRALQPPVLDPKILPEAGDVRLIIGRRAIAREVSDLLHSARSLVAIECSEGGVRRVGRHVENLLASALPDAGAPRIEIFLPPTAAREFLGGDAAASPRITTFRMRTPSPSLAFISDGGRLLVARPVPDSDDVGQGRDFGILTTDRAFVTSRLQLLRDASDPMDS